MAKKEAVCPTCPSTSCLRWWGVIVVLVGILYLGQDLHWWNFWTLNWWTVGFLLVGLCKLCWSYVVE